MNVQEVIMRAMVRKITWYEAAEIIGISCRQMRRWKQRWEEHGYDGLFDRRRGTPSPKRVAVATVGEVVRLYEAQYSDFNVKHFHEKLKRELQLKLSYTWVKTALQTAGLVRRGRKRSPHRKRREPKPLPGMLHIDGSKDQWFGDGCYYRDRARHAPSRFFCSDDRRFPLTRQRLTNFALNGTDQTVSEITVTNVAGNSTVTTTTIDRAAKKQVNNIETPDSNTNAVSININGLTQSSVPNTPQLPTTYL